MALFADGPASTIDDLTDQDSGLLDVAQSAGINVTTKLRLAKDELATDLQLWLWKSRPAPESSTEGWLKIEQIVMTPALKRWETMLALTMFYRDAYLSELADRYQGKWQEYARLARDARESFIASGMALVNDPVAQAGPPILGTVPGPQPGGTFYASVAWVNSMGQEGMASPASSIAVPDGNLMTVTATGEPQNAMAFRVYAGTSLDRMYRQNDIDLAVGLSYIYIPGQFSQGQLPGWGQNPDFVRPLTRTWLRG
jgi:hypothetical protein